MSKKPFIQKYVPVISFVTTFLLILLVYYVNIPNPNLILVTFIVYFTFLGGYFSGAISGLLTIIYSIVFFSNHEQVFTYTLDNLKRVIVSIIFIPIMVLIVGYLKNQLIKKTKDLETVNEELNFCSIHDFLTGIPNRRFFDKVINVEWLRALREQKPITIIIMDIDYFKKYNDTYGHILGDNALREVARVIQKEIRRAGDFAARYGGEEFVVILPNTPMEGALLVGENIRKSVENLQIPHKASLVNEYLTISEGLATMMPSANSSYSELLNKADSALYEAKEKGRNCIVVFEEQTKEN